MSEIHKDNAFCKAELDGLYHTAFLTLTFSGVQTECALLINIEIVYRFGIFNILMHQICI
jgi:hypothetical protein